MSIKKQLIWEPSKREHSCSINFGDECGFDLSNEVLVFMIVFLTKRFKCPIVFFYNSVLITILISAIKKLHAIGIRICSVTCDEAFAKVQYFKKLRCDFDVKNIDIFSFKFTVDNNLMLMLDDKIS